MDSNVATLYNDCSLISATEISTSIYIMFLLYFQVALEGDLAVGGKIDRHRNEKHSCDF